MGQEFPRVQEQTLMQQFTVQCAQERQGQDAGLQVKATEGTGEFCPDRILLVL